MASLQQLNYFNAAAYAANAIIVHFVGAAGAFGAKSNAEISAEYPTLVTPAGWAFSIWGIIFFAQLVWVISQLTASYRASPLVIDGVGWYYVGVCAAQIAWTLFFTFELIFPSFIAMLAILACLVMIVTKQYKLGRCASAQDYWFLEFPFSIHAGWIVAASLVNTSLLLVKWNAGATLQFGVALLSLVVAILVAIYCLHLTRPDFVIALVLVWALFAIGQELKEPKDLINNTFSSGQISTVRIGSIVLASLILVGVLVRAYLVSKNRRSSTEDDDTPAAQPSDPLVYQSAE